MFVGLTDLKVRLGVTGSGSDAPLTAALTAADAAVRACLNFSPEGWTGTEFVSGTEIFGERIQPLMHCRRHVAPPTKAAARSPRQAAAPS